MTEITKKQKYFYVYALIDPRDNSFFYIGKGKNKRVNQHVIDAKARRICNVAKHVKIHSIMSAGLKVRGIILKYFEYENDAYSYEKQLIETFKATGITNITGGQNGCSSENEKAFYKLLHMISRIKPFDVWLIGAKKEVLDYAIKNYGSPQNYYLNFLDEIQELLNLTRPKKINYGT